MDELEEVLVRRIESRIRLLESGARYEKARRQVADRAVDPYTAADELIEGLGL
jgi:hypothetical protein